MPGLMVLPKVAGLNRYRHLPSCAFLYSSKPLPQDETLKTVFELSDDDILTAREDEDIYQFVFRGALRHRDYAGVYDIYLYSLAQAERLRERMNGSGLGDVELVPVTGAGIMEVIRPNTPRISSLSAGDAAERIRRKKESNARRNRDLRARKKAAPLASA